MVDFVKNPTCCVSCWCQKKNEPRKKTSYFPLNPGCLIGFNLQGFMKLSPYNWVVCHPIYNSTNPGSFSWLKSPFELEELQISAPGLNKTFNNMTMVFSGQLQAIFPLVEHPPNFPSLLFCLQTYPSLFKWCQKDKQSNNLYSSHHFHGNHVPWIACTKRNTIAWLSN